MLENDTDMWVPLDRTESDPVGWGGADHLVQRDNVNGFSEVSPTYTHAAFAPGDLNTASSFCK